MLHDFELSKIKNIVEIAATKMSELDFKAYQLLSVVWDDDDNEWVVKFYSDYGSFEYTKVFVVEISNGKFRLSGYTHDSD